MTEDGAHLAYPSRERALPTRNFSDPAYRTQHSTLDSLRYTPPPTPPDALRSHPLRQPLKLQVDHGSRTANDASSTQYLPSPGGSKPSSPVSPRVAHYPVRRASSQILRHRAASPLSQQRFPEVVDDSNFQSQSGLGQVRGRMRQAAPLDSLYSDTPGVEYHPTRARGMTATNTSPLRAHGVLRTATSIPDYGPVRSGQRNNANAVYNPDRGRPRQDSYQSSFRQPLFRRGEDDTRSSMRSGFTTTSSSFLEASGTERSSVVTKSSSNSELRESFAKYEDDEQGMSVEDAIMMYEEGFEDISSSFDGPDEGYQSQAALQTPAHSNELTPESTPDMVENPVAPTERELPPTPDDDIPPLPLPPKDPMPLPQDSLAPPRAVLTRDSSQFFSGRSSTYTMNPPAPNAVPRDRYGFKKATLNVTVETYDAWNSLYVSYLERRRKKWDQLMRHHNISTEKPDRFPPKSDKVKRYVRKGIPPDWRGAAWFFYGGGPEWLANHKDLYWTLVEQVKQGKLSDFDKEQIERDLNRTFPDNDRFKPESVPPSSTPDSGYGRGSHSPTPSQSETPIIRALRRVLQAFAIHNPSIGYCQSLNFLAGLLLLFLDEDEERAFVMLNIVTTVHLPGTHSKILEANIDIGVLMSCIKESMPGVWNKINDMDDPSSNSASLSPASVRLPTVSLATTSWFMSLFVGSLPTETVLRVWDSFFYEGSKTLFRIALAIFKLGEQEIRAISDPMEIFQIVQTIPRRVIDPNELMETCFKRRNGFGHISQGEINDRRADRRRMHADDMARINGGGGVVQVEKPSIGLRRAASRARMKRSASKKRS